MIAIVRRCVASCAGFLVASAVCVPVVASASTPTSATAACSVVRAADVQHALGVEASKVNGPSVVRPGTCTWNSGDPTCVMRSLSVELRRGSSAVVNYAHVQAEALSMKPVFGVGDAAFTSIEALPFGAAVMISHLDARRGDTTLHLTLLGRLAPDGSVDLLRQVATSAMAPTTR